MTDEEREQLILGNQRLVTYTVKVKFRMDAKNVDLFQEFISVGMVGLVKAGRTFNPDYGVKFSTYAGRCIENEILMELRRRRRRHDTISLQQGIGENDHGDVQTFEAILVDPNAMMAFEEVVERDDRESTVNAAIRILKVMRPDRAMAVKLRFINGLKQRDAAKVMGKSQSYVSRLTRSGVEELQARLKHMA